jgi:MFS transporter, PAT family, beta-lactamase induction signal transducer AmpG
MIPPWLAALLTRRMLICVFTGFASGLPLYLLFNLVPAWLATEKVSLKAIGLFSLIQFPYTWKFIWSPFLDRYALPLLGRRRGWMFVSQALLLPIIAFLGVFSPQNDLRVIVVLATLLAIVSATQDIVIDAFRREILPDQELGLGNSVHVNAYRVASLVPGSLSLILAHYIPWQQVFLITSLFMIPGLAMTLMVKEPAVVGTLPRNLEDAVVKPFQEFIRRAGWRGAALVLTFIFLYKLGDSMCTALATPFYLDMGFNTLQIGAVAKHAGLWPAVIGGLVGGLWMVRLGINRALWLFGVVQLLSIFGFAWLAWVGPQTQVDAPRLVQLAVVIGFEALGVGLGTAAFVAFIARSTNPLYTATQFALFTSLAAVPRTFGNAITGWLVEGGDVRLGEMLLFQFGGLGWTNFFFLCAALALPGMCLLPWVAPWREHNKITA